MDVVVTVRKATDLLLDEEEIGTFSLFQLIPQH